MSGDNTIYTSNRKTLEEFYESEFLPYIKDIRNCIIENSNYELFHKILLTFLKTSNIASEDFYELIIRK